MITSELVDTNPNRGDIVSYQNYVLGRMPEVWGEDAAVFNPYRWFKESGESISYSTFSKPRAALEVQIMISRFLML